MLLSVILSLGMAVVPALILHLIRIPAGAAGESVAGRSTVRGEAALLATPKLPATPELPATQELLATPKLPATQELSATPELPAPAISQLPPPAGVVVTVGTKPRARAVPTTTIARPTTTATTTERAEAARVDSQTGQASWYGGTKGQCAHRTIPLRTVVKVVNVDNGRETYCTVTNRGPYMAGRVIDLTKATFAELAPAGRGVINVRLEW